MVTDHPDRITEYIDELIENHAYYLRELSDRYRLLYDDARAAIRQSDKEAHDLIALELRTLTRLILAVHRYREPFKTADDEATDEGL